MNKLGPATFFVWCRSHKRYEDIYLYFTVFMTRAMWIDLFHYNDMGLSTILRFWFLSQPSLVMVRFRHSTVGFWQRQTRTQIVHLCLWPLGSSNQEFPTRATVIQTPRTALVCGLGSTALQYSVSTQAKHYGWYMLCAVWWRRLPLGQFSRR